VEAQNSLGMNCRRRLLIGVLVWSWSVLVARADEVDRYLARFIQNHGIPALSVGVIRNGRLIKTAGYGTANLELHVVATENTAYEIGSITKQFTAEAVMLLVEEKKIGLDDPLSTYLPDVPKAWDQITIRHLLTHLSGLKDWDGTGVLSYRREYTPREYIELVAASPLDFPPGEKSVYTSAGYPLLGLVIEKVAREPYEQFVADRIFQPLGMSASRFKHPGEIVFNRAAGYVDVNGRLGNGEPLRPSIIAPSGGIISTVVDMAKWDAALASGRLLKASSMDLMVEPARLNNGRPGISGIAWFPDVFHGHRIVLHNGSTLAGFSSVVYRYLDDKLTVVVLCNIDRWNAVNVAAQHVAGIYVPGIGISSLVERPDPAPRRSQALLGFLEGLAQGLEPEMLAPGLRIPPERRTMIAAHLRDLRRFVFLENEDLGERGQERFGEVIRSVCRYRIETKRNWIYYTFELTADNKVARFVPEED
jgi:D-alanyl-D-alanine carboxypeptidase